ncbi:hypothetical protein BG011_007670 [Mortierella polycephala]|uniref:Uncharacterized protein n=1 Tax=Mortierella polycephala TaxID=41804 RepID=A0A9P6QF55_9FUNG|nr:hypothetical protein BG011_007670 [Mortierella polycephala]
MAETGDIHTAMERNQAALQDIDHMIDSLNDVRSSVHHVFHLLQGRTEPETGATFREHARFTYSALECLAKLALSSEALLNDTQTLELPKLQGPSPISLEAKQKNALQEEKAVEGSMRTKFGATETSIDNQASQDYLNLSIDDTLRFFSRSMRKSGRKVRASRMENQPPGPFTILKVNVAGVMNAMIVMETNKRDRCLSISRLVVFGAGEENSIWEDSNHLVFRKITQIAVGAVDFFMSKEPRSILGLVLRNIEEVATDNLSLAPQEPMNQ